MATATIEWKPAAARWTYGDACSRLRELEAKASLLDRHRCLGWAVWPLFRPILARRMCEITIDTSGEKPGAGRFFAGMEIFWDGLQVLFRSGEIRGQALVLTSSSEWRIASQEGRKSIYFGDLPKLLPDQVQVEWLNRETALQDRESRAWPVEGSLRTWTRIASYLKRVYAKFGRFREEARAIKEDLRELEDQCGRELMTTREIHRVLCDFAARFKVFRWLWARMKPRTLALTCFYGKEPEIAAAKATGIRVIELQHGTIYDGHFGYSYDPAQLGDCKQTLFPDLFCGYGRFWLEAMKGFGYWQPEQFVVCGSVEVDRVRSLRPLCGSSSTKTLVVTTQGIYEPELMKFLEEFIASLARDWSVVIRTHPIQNEVPLRNWVERIDTRFPDIEVRISSGAESNQPTIEVIAAATWHASISSTCHVEALGIGVSTVVIPLPTSENLSYLRGQNGAFFPRTPGEMSDIVQSEEAHLQESDSNFFFKSGALKNLADVLQAES